MRNARQPPPSSDELQEGIVRDLLGGYQRFGAIVIPVFSSEHRLSLELPEGETLAYLAALKHIPTLDEELVSWDEILDFRTDREAVCKYRNLRLWLRDGLQAASLSQAIDVIGKKIDDYIWALKKHGLRTSSGLLTFLLDPKRVSSSTLVAAATAVASDSAVISALASGITIIGQTCVWLSDRKIEKRDLERGHGSEVAVICDIQRRFGFVHSACT